jgi:hypothetical protein
MSAARGTVTHDAILRRMYDFCAAHGYTSTVQCLQIESRVPYNILPRGVAVDDLSRSVLAGDWDTVLTKHLQGFLLPRALSFAIYELVVEEAAAEGYGAAAKTLLQNSPVFSDMLTFEPTRHRRLMSEAASSACALQPAPIAPAALEARRRRLLEQILAVVEPGDTHQSLQPDLATCVFRGIAGGGSEMLMNRSESTSAPPSSDAAHVASPSARARQLLAGDMITSCPTRIRQRIAFEASGDVPGGVEAMTKAKLRRGGGAPDDVLLTASHHGSLRLWAVSSAAPLTAPSASHLDAALSMSTADASPRGDFSSCFVGVGYRDGAVKVYEAAVLPGPAELPKSVSLRLVRKVPDLHTLGVVSVAFVGQTLRALHGDGSEGVVDTAKSKCLLVTASFDGSMCLLSVLDGRSAATRLVNPHLVSVPGSSVTTTRLARFGDHQMLSVGHDGRLVCWRAGHAAHLAVDKDVKPIDVTAATRRRVQQSTLHLRLEPSETDLVPKDVVVIAAAVDGEAATSYRSSLVAVGLNGCFVALVDVMRGSVRSVVLLPAGYCFRGLCASAAGLAAMTSSSVVASVFMAAADGSIHFASLDGSAIPLVLEPEQSCTAIPTELGLIVDDLACECVGPFIVASSFTQKSLFVLE